MSGARAASRRGVVAASNHGPGGVESVNYPNFPEVPDGTIDVALTPGAGPVTVNGTTLQEGARVSGTGTMYSAAVLPDTMSTDLFSVTVTVGSLSAAANDRGVGAGVFNADGTAGIACYMTSASGTAVIRTMIGGTGANQATLGSKVAVPGVTITLTPTVSGGVVTWTVSKNGTPIGLSWTDTGHILDLPGRHPAAAFRHAYSGADYASRGVAALSASVI